MKVVQTIWFNTLRGTAGIALGIDEITEKRKAYLGIVLGIDEAQDTDLIAREGAPITKHIIKAILKHLEGE